MTMTISSVPHWPARLRIAWYALGGRRPSLPRHEREYVRRHDSPSYRKLNRRSGAEEFVQRMPAPDESVMIPIMGTDRPAPW